MLTNQMLGFEYEYELGLFYEIVNGCVVIILLFVLTSENLGIKIYFRILNKNLA